MKGIKGMTSKYKHLPSSLSLFRDVLTNNVLFVRSILDSPLLMYESGQKTKDNTKKKKRKKRKKKRMILKIVKIYLGRSLVLLWAMCGQFIFR